jgi:CDP-diglyceride synthetase
LVLLAAASRFHALPWSQLLPGALGSLGYALPCGVALATQTARARLFAVLPWCWPAVSLTAATQVAARPNLLGEVAFLYGVLEVNDSVAFLVGRAFGRHKLAPRLSPHKTWEGFLSGIAAAALAGAAFPFFSMGSWLAQAALALGVALLGVAADLSTSALKRAVGVKDYGALLGPHGGFLDAYDAWLLVLGVYPALSALMPNG